MVGLVKLKMFIQETLVCDELKQHEVAIIHYNGFFNSFDVNSYDCEANKTRFETLNADIVHKTTDR
jgi:hypothetical protein